MPYNAAPGEQAPSEEAKRKAEAAKRFIENMYKMQSQNSRERRERCVNQIFRSKARAEDKAPLYSGSTRRTSGTLNALSVKFFIDRIAYNLLVSAEAWNHCRVLGNSKTSK